MRLRDMPHRDNSTVFLLGGLNPHVLHRLPGALETVISGARGAEWRVRVPTLRGQRRRLSVVAAGIAARHSTQELSATLSDAETIRASRKWGFHGLPVALTLSGDRAAVLVWHAIADASGALELVHRLMEAAAGAPSPEDRCAPTAFPLLRAALAAGPRSLPELLRWRAANRPSPYIADGAPRATPGRFAHLRLASPTLAQVRATRGSSARATQNSRLADLVLSALKSVYRGTSDLPVKVPVDLRGHVAGGCVNGNFFVAEPIGGLLTADWSASMLSEQLAVMSSRVGVAALVVALQGFLRSQLTGRRRRPSYSLNLSVIRSPRPFPASLFTGPDAVRLGCGTRSPWPSAVLVIIWSAGHDVHLSLWDETGLFEVDRFPDAFRDEIERRLAVLRPPD